MTEAMAAARWRKTGKGVAQSSFNLVKIGATEITLDWTAMITRGRENEPKALAEIALPQMDRTPGEPTVTDIVGEIKKYVIHKKDRLVKGFGSYYYNYEL